MLTLDLPQNHVFGDRLRAWRKAFLNLTQVEFASETGVHLSAIRKYERRAVVPRGDSLVAIAKTGVNLHWLLTGEGDFRAPKEDILDGASQAVPDQFGAWIEVIRALIDNIPSDRRTTVLEAMLSSAQQAKQISDLERTVQAMKKSLASLATGTRAGRPQAARQDRKTAAKPHAKPKTPAPA